MSGPRRSGVAAVACFGAGAALLLVAEPAVLRLAGSVLLLAAVFLGVVAIATPELLRADEEGRQGEGP